MEIRAFEDSFLKIFWREES
jgi:hypothetical protein